METGIGSDRNCDRIFENDVGTTFGPLGPGTCIRDIFLIKECKVSLATFQQGIYGFDDACLAGVVSTTDRGEVPVKANLDCSGLLIPDTEMGGKFTAIAEVFHDKTTSYVFHRVQA